MKFTWDSAKHDRNVRERGFGFDVAARIFNGRVVEIEVGEAEGIVFVVVYTDRGDVRCIISARQADKKERIRWHSR